MNALKSCAVAALLTTVVVGGAWAQGDITPELRRSAQLSGEQISTVQRFIRDNTGSLASDNPQMVRRNRTALLEHLTDIQASPAFRVEFSKAIVPLLKPLVASEADLTVVNALVLAGDVATGDSMLILRDALKSAKPAIRYQAAFGMRRTFEALASMATPTLRSDQAEEGVSDLTKQLSVEADELVIDGLTYATIEAAKAPGLRNFALLRLCETLSVKLKSMSGGREQFAGALLRAGVGVRDALSATQVGGQGGQSGPLSAEATRACAELGGQLIAYCVRSVENKALPMAQRGEAGYSVREVYAQLATTAENIVLLAATLQGVQAPQSRRIGDRLKTSTTSGDVSFGEDARLLVGKAGLLSKPPFSFDPTTFLAN